jgi:hypothetical protein
MFFSSWSRTSKTKRRAGRRANSTFRPRLEVLEGRDVPSNTLTVTNLDDNSPGSLRYEIAQVSSKDNTIVFDKKLSGTITLTSGELVISKSLTIKGPGEFRLTIASQPWIDMAFDSHHGSRILEVDGGGTIVTVSGLTITGGGGTRLGGGFIGNPNDPNDGYGGAILNFGTLYVSNCMLGGNNEVGFSGVQGNEAKYGGAIANFGTMTVTGCDVSNDLAVGAADDLGGGIYNAGTMTVSGGDVSGNFADEGGGIYNTDTMTVSGCTLSADSASNGGGIFNGAPGTMTVSGCTLSGDHALSVGGAGGGILNLGAASALTVSNSIFSNNTPDNIHGSYTDGGGNTFN